MDALREAGLVEVIRGLEQPVLGICLGLQLLYDHSDEGDCDCLGLIPGRVTRLEVDTTLRLPHMGWNQLDWSRTDDPLADGLTGREWFYFVHSYGAPTDHAVATSRHGQAFAAVVRHNNFAACQFSSGKVRQRRCPSVAKLFWRAETHATTEDTENTEKSKGRKVNAPGLYRRQLE